mgnify:CR=1 FL=1
MKTEESRGHTCAPIKRVAGEASKLSGLDKGFIQEVIEKEIKFFPRNQRRDQETVSTDASERRDRNIAQFIKYIADKYSSKRHRKFEKNERFNHAKHFCKQRK